LVLADRLRVVHGGCDQLLEVDVLDVECLAHMRAARAQELRHLLLILSALEACFHRVRRGRELTERERGRQDFVQDGFPGTVRREKAGTAPPLSQRYKMAFWGVRFLLRINLVTRCICLRGGASSCGRDAEPTHSLTGGEHPIENSVEIYLGGGFAGHRIAPRPPHKYDGETALRACWVRDPRFPRLRRGRTGARRLKSNNEKGSPEGDPLARIGL